MEVYDPFSNISVKRIGQYKLFEYQSEKLLYNFAMSPEYY